MIYTEANHKEKDTIMKKKFRIVRRIILFGILITLILIVTIPRLKPLFKKEETIFCHIENNITEIPFPRYECLTLKITTKEMNMVGIEQFSSLNMTYKCSKDFLSLPECEGNNYYFSAHALKIFCDNCNIDGYMGVGYVLTYYKNDSTLIYQYEELFMDEKYPSKEAMIGRLLDYDRDNEGKE